MGVLDTPDAAGGHDHLQLAPGEIEELRQDWERHRTVFHAADLVDAAFVAGKPEVALDAASFLSHNGVTEISRQLAGQILMPADKSTTIVDPPDIQPSERYQRIAHGKRHLRMYPRDPIRWVDLARDYSILGQNGPAGEALRRALALAPDSRFVLRSAARFFLHTDEAEQAHDLLRRVTRTNADPWLLAAEIVAGQIAGRTSRHIKQGISLITSGRHHPRHISELAGAIGTLEHEHGDRRGMRRLFSIALEDPTENTLAQANWMARHVRSFERPRDQHEVPRAYEANAWEAVQEGRYSDALDLSWKWLLDEPFSTRPAFFGSWVAATALEKLETAIKFMQVIEVAHPTDPRVLTQLIFCNAALGRLSLAEELLAKLPLAISSHPDAGPAYEWEILTSADLGLIAYRRGQPETARLHYRNAIAIAQSRDSKEAAAVAMIYQAREEIRAGTAESTQFLQAAAKVLDVFTPSIRPAYEALLYSAVQVSLYR
ncbi:MAG TPA: hypothetical protein VNJ70_14260 [Thermoanaerobaculia bacterium]|nr:hypothetical protein [Thermoanaerobaculia bacterium]